MNKRDEFSKAVKLSVAQRVANKCSCPGCPEKTIGPGSRSETHVLNLGVAAHITAASPGGPRYDPTISASERSSIRNAIWLCKKHSEVIDKDPTAFTAETLRDWKKLAEEKASRELLNCENHPHNLTTLVSIGPDIICEAVWQTFELHDWVFKIISFESGSLDELFSFAQNFDEQRAYEKYLLLETQGDGRVLNSIKIENGQDGIVVTFRVQGRFPTRNPNAIGNDLALGDDFGIMFENGDFKLITGKDVARQNIRTTLSTVFGDIIFDPLYGSFFSKYIQEFRHDPVKLERMLKLEITRLLAIPVFGGSPSSFEPILPFLNRIFSIKIISQGTDNDQTKVLLAGEWGNGERFEEQFLLMIRNDSEDDLSCETSPDISNNYTIVP